MEAREIIRDARVAARLSQRELAARAGTSGPAISFYESGERVPRYDTLVRILDAAGGHVHVAVEFDRPSIDVHDNARRLCDVLDLAEALPQHHANTLDYPVLRDLTSHRRR